MVQPGRHSRDRHQKRHTQSRTYGVSDAQQEPFGIHGTPAGLTERLEKQLGPFPFQTFWGPMAGLPCTQWIARCAADVLATERPDLTLVYLPHLDYDPQRFGPKGCDMKRLVGELDDACAPLLDAARSTGARVWVVSEYGHVQVSRPIYPQPPLRTAKLLDVRHGPFGEHPDLFTSRAFAVCDHQLAHVYIPDEADVPRVRDLLAVLPGVARVVSGEERVELGLNHERAGELVLLSEPDAWFAYPFWEDDRLAPDYARAVDIHRKPGYDPCELFFDPKLWWPKGRAIRRLIQKKLGFRTLFDVVPLDASLVRGSHGLWATDPIDGPLLIGDGTVCGEQIEMPAVRDLVLEGAWGSVRRAKPICRFAKRQIGPWQRASAHDTMVIEAPLPIYARGFRRCVVSSYSLRFLSHC